MTLLGGLGMGLLAAILGGWLPGLIIFTVLGLRENGRRSADVVLEQFRDYWAARTQAAEDLRRGADPMAVRDHLWGFRIGVEELG